MKKEGMLIKKQHVVALLWKEGCSRGSNLHAQEKINVCSSDVELDLAMTLTVSL